MLHKHKLSTLLRLRLHHARSYTKVLHKILMVVLSLEHSLEAWCYVLGDAMPYAWILYMHAGAEEWHTTSPLLTRAWIGCCRPTISSVGARVSWPFTNVLLGGLGSVMKKEGQIWRPEGGGSQSR